MGYKNRNQLIAENARLRAQVAGAKSKKAKSKKVFKNIVGYPCGSAHTANFSSHKIVRHLTGQCGCDDAPGKGFKCYAMKKYDGMDYANWGSKPNLVWHDVSA